TKISWLRDDYSNAVKAIKERLMRTTDGPLKLTYVGEKVRYTSSVVPKMDHLVCFLPGTLALGYHLYNTHNQKKLFTEDFKEHLAIAESLARTCFQMYNSTATGLSPEIAYFESGENEVRIRPADSHNLLRPEYVESLFYLYHITGKQIYRDQGWQIFEAFNRYCKVKSGGYTSIGDVRNPKQTRPKDMQESFWSAETLKYLYLLFSDDKVLIDKLLNYFVFNTEAHLIPV
ncbi:endoplasmic reticulum mannosyl-oligosaccharide 1:2-alpha-mannosidase-like protein, partial [Leptotrombidium deliense]